MSTPAAREIAVYDDDRHVVWRSALAAGEVAAFHVDARTGRHVTDRGLRPPSHWARTCLVFPDVAKAVSYARSHVAQHPDVAVRIFDAASPDGAPAAVVENEEALAGVSPATAKRRAWWGISLIVLGIACFVFDWFHGWLLIVGVVVGSKFLTIGLFRLGEGISHLWERHHAKPRRRIDR